MSTLFLHTPANKRLVWYLAAEEYVAKHIDRLLPSADHEGILLVWIVDPTVIIGRHQVLKNEVNTAFCQEHNRAISCPKFRQSHHIYKTEQVHQALRCYRFRFH